MISDMNGEQPSFALWADSEEESKAFYKRMAAEARRDMQTLELMWVANAYLTRMRESHVYGFGAKGFEWARELSPDGQWLFLMLIKDLGDREDLPGWAEEEGANLERAIHELKERSLLDDSDPAVFRLNRRDARKKLGR